MRCRRATRQRSTVPRLSTPPSSVFGLKSLRQLQLTLRASGAVTSLVPVLPRAKATMQTTTLGDHPDTVLALKQYLNKRSSLNLRRPLKMNKAHLGVRTLRVLQQHLNHQLGHR